MREPNATASGGGCRRRGHWSGCRAWADMGGGTNRRPPWRLRGLASERVLGRRVRVATTRRSRLLGLTLLRRDLAGSGLLLPRCRAVHTLGMRFAIDVLFLDDGARPLRVERGVLPGRFLVERRAAAVLELPAEAGFEQRDRRWALTPTAARQAAGGGTAPGPGVGRCDESRKR